MHRGTAVAHHNIVYCISLGSHSVHQYHVDKDDWKRHSQCPRSWTGLDLLTAIGGKERSGNMNKLVSYSHGRWEMVFPPMNYVHLNHAMVSDDHYIIAVEGDD